MPVTSATPRLVLNVPVDLDRNPALVHEMRSAMRRIRSSTANPKENPNPTVAARGGEDVGGAGGAMELRSGLCFDID